MLLYIKPPSQNKKPPIWPVSLLALQKIVPFDAHLFDFYVCKRLRVFQGKRPHAIFCVNAPINSILPLVKKSTSKMKNPHKDTHRHHHEAPQGYRGTLARIVIFRLQRSPSSFAFRILLVSSLLPFDPAYSPSSPASFWMPFGVKHQTFWQQAARQPQRQAMQIEYSPSDHFSWT